MDCLAPSADFGVALSTAALGEKMITAIIVALLVGALGFIGHALMTSSSDKGAADQADANATAQSKVKAAEDAADKGDTGGLDELP